MGGGELDSEIKELMEYIEASSFVEFELEREGFKIKLVKRSIVTNGAAPSLSPAAQMAAATAVTQAAEAPVPRPAAVEAPDVHVVKSPIVGTFYRSSSPTARSFVEIGDRVKKGQVLCIIEAMKLMNEIESDCDGEIVKVYVENGKPVQFGDRLFAVKIA